MKHNTPWRGLNYTQIDMYNKLPNLSRQVVVRDDSSPYVWE